MDQLDALQRYWGAALGVDAMPAGLPVRVQFRALPGYAALDDQLVQWQISSGETDIRYPNTGARTLTWVVGHSVGLGFELAAQSRWSVMPDPAQRDFIADGKTAAFVQAGPWALLRLIDAHRPRQLPATMVGLPPRYWLEFRIPVADARQERSEVRVYIGLIPEMPLPVDYPGSAPQLYQ